MLKIKRERPTSCELISGDSGTDARSDKQIKTNEEYIQANNFKARREVFKTYFVDN